MSRPIRRRFMRRSLDSVLILHLRPMEWSPASWPWPRPTPSWNLDYCRRGAGALDSTAVRSIPNRSLGHHQGGEPEVEPVSRFSYADGGQTGSNGERVVRVP